MSLRKNLIWRMAALLTFFACFILASFFVFIKPFLLSKMLEDSTNNLLALSTSLANQTGILIDENCSEKWITDLTNQYLAEYSVQISFTIPNCGEKELFPIDISKFYNRPLISQTLAGESISEVTENALKGIKVISISVPIRKNNQIVGAVEIKKGFDAGQILLADLSSRFLILWGISTSLALLLGIYLSNYYSKSLARINQSINKLPQFEDDPSLNRKDEIGQLFKSLASATKKMNGVIDRLEKDNQSLSVILDEMEDGVLITDNQGNVTFINPAVIRFFGLDKHPTLHHNLVETLRDHRLEELRLKSKDSHLPQRISFEIAAHKLFLDCIISPLKTGYPGSTLFLFQDITELRKLENVRRDFVSNVSHELRTPLASLKAITDTLQRNIKDDKKETKRFLKLMDGEIDHLTHMVQELVELSRIESGKMLLKKELVSPIELAKRAVDRMKLQADRANLGLSFLSSGEIPLILVDPTRIEQVLLNLIHNAIKYTEPGGKINISVELQDRDVLFCVRDNGIGIPPRDLERIFERFYKVDRSRSEQGTGLGLSIARHIVTAHGGQIWAESIQTQGSTFFFSLPVSA